MFYAKPSGGYATDSTEWTNNIIAVYSYLSPLGYTLEAVSGMIGNMYKESGVNPWRWEGNNVNYNRGYGLMQFTPASGYINLTGIPSHAPNLSTSQQTTGASPDDGYAQLYVFDNDTLSKWYSGLWRSYWSSSVNPVTYTMYQNIKLQYGNNISMSEFKSMTDLTYATLTFLGCYEGPHDYDPDHPSWYQTIDDNFDDRYNYALHIYDVLGGVTPGASNILIELKILDVNQKRKFQNI